METFTQVRVVAMLAVAAVVLGAGVPLAADGPPTMVREGVLEIDDAGLSPIAATTIDPDGRYLYAATDTSPARVLRIDLATRTVSRDLSLGAEAHRAVAIDLSSDGDHLYVATAGNDSTINNIAPRLTKVDVDAFAVQEATSLEFARHRVATAMTLDAAGTVAYVATYNRWVVRIDLASMTPDDEVQLSQGGLLGGYPAMALTPDGSRIHLVTNAATPHMVVVDAADLTEVTAFALAPEGQRTDNPRAILMDPSGRFAHVALGVATVIDGQGRPGVARIDLEALEMVDVVAFTMTRDIQVRTAVADPDSRYGYVSLGPSLAQPGHIIQIDLDALQLVGRLNIDEPGERAFTALSVEPDGQTLHAAGGINRNLMVHIGLGGVAPPPTDDGSVRLDGVDRFQTAAEIALDRFDPDDVDTVYLATGLDFPDALAGGPLAAVESAPILLSLSDALPPDTSRALGTLNPERVVALGGQAALGDAVLAAAGRAAGDATTQRLSGNDRFATAAAIAAAMPDGDTVYLATGGDFPDALAGGAVSDGAPILLAAPGFLPEPTIDILAARRPARVVALGGPAAISNDVLTAAATAAGGATTTRLAGGDRFTTSAAIANTLDDPDTVYVATGINFPDALAGGPAAVAEGAPILLTLRDTIPAPTATYLDSLTGLRRIVILGGPNAISPAVADQLAARIDD